MSQVPSSVYPYPPDKVAVSASYSEAGGCDSLDVRMNYDGITLRDLEAVIRRVFSPRAAGETPPMVTVRDHELGETRVLFPNGDQRRRGGAPPLNDMRSVR